MAANVVAFEACWLNCSTCGVLFALLRGHVAVLERTGDDFRCPNGHENSFCTEDDYEDDEECDCDQCEALTKTRAENVKLRAKLRELGHEPKV
jgi:hypothetical protein